MTPARFPLLRALCALCALCVNSFFFFASASLAQNLDKPLQSIDEEITAFAYAPDGRIVYSVYRKLKTKVYDLEHDDIWLQEANGKRRRLLEGQKFNRGNQPFSYIVDSLRWSPNGHAILVQLFTTTVVDDSGKAEDSFQTLLLDDSGREIRINKGDSVIPGAANAVWLSDNATIAYLSESLKPRLLFSLKFTRPATTKSPPSPTPPMAASSIPSIANLKQKSTTSSTTTSGFRKPTASAAACSKAKSSTVATSPSATSSIPCAGRPTAI